jgi:DNA-binding LytR/AlgR family response regulator
MPGIKTIIVDDEPLARRGLRQLLASHTDFKVIAEARNGVEAISAVRSFHPDLLFLDVQMPEPDGFGVLKEIGPSLMPLVIFVTAYDEFAVRAFDAYALDYLVKPIQEKRFVLMRQWRCQGDLRNCLKNDVARPSNNVWLCPRVQGNFCSTLLRSIGLKRMIITPLFMPATVVT